MFYKKLLNISLFRSCPPQVEFDPLLMYLFASMNSFVRSWVSQSVGPSVRPSGVSQISQKWRPDDNRTSGNPYNCIRFFHSFVHSFICSFIHWFIHSIIHPFIHSFGRILVRTKLVWQPYSLSEHSHVSFVSSDHQDPDWAFWIKMSGH